jgi:hypothetical protein
MDAAEKGVTAAAVAWLAAAVFSFCLPFILGGAWNMLNGPGVLVLIAWALAQAGLCMWKGIACLLWAAG